MGITVIEKKAIIMKVNKGLKDFFKEIKEEFPEGYNVRELYDKIFDMEIPISDNYSIRMEQLINAAMNVMLKDDGAITRKFVRDSLSDIIDHDGLIINEETEED